MNRAQTIAVLKSGGKRTSDSEVPLTARFAIMAPLAIVWPTRPHMNPTNPYSTPLYSKAVALDWTEYLCTPGMLFWNTALGSLDVNFFSPPSKPFP
eukprot:CAMPEP_0198243798 /NCGR_PEP_ID=MMETSP1446-20131203/30841_1 /TAXON_ID=1461542 ORGANISM="Unidentified sp, Strain CCMP2111" /NCGR_SAMPLE_ID=MMETSP1446 /ASSEMBLY_ACC=CAM_ASM_001112 /LENGTH=95 /DNA_ID=CAMNT_0043927723 /DNA_START=203 /DNA_END=490 /DNA_ORIENTATION=+